MSQILLVDGPIYREDLIKNAETLYDQQLTRELATRQFKNTSKCKLEYDGRYPRKDVLLKLKEIAFTLETLSQYPYLNLPVVKHIIKDVLNNPDSRTLNKYVGCINNWLNLKGQKLSYQKDSDFTGFRESILKHLESAN